MGAAILALLPALPSIITGVEKLWGMIPKSGSSKLTAVVKTLITLYTELESAGLVPKGTPSPSSDAMLGAIESTLAGLKENGVITTGTGAKTSVAPIYSIQGTLTLGGSK